MTEDVLAKEMEFYRQKKAELLQSIPGRFVLIKDAAVQGDYATFSEALKASLERFGDVPILIKQVVADEPSASTPALMAGLSLVYVQ